MRARNKEILIRVFGVQIFFFLRRVNSAIRVLYKFDIEKVYVNDL